MDGASKGNPGDAGAGGVFRDDSRLFLSAFTEKLDNATVTRAEIIALKRGLLVAKRKLFTKLLVQTDLRALTLILKDDRNDNPTHAHLIQQCR